MKSVKKLIVAVVVAVIGIGQARADLISNGSFETAGVSSTDAADWTTINPGMYTERTGTVAGLAPQSGSYFFNFSNFAPGSGTPSGDSGVAQTVSDTSGQQYVLSFYYSNSTNSDISNHFNVSWNGTTLMDLSNFAGLGAVWKNVSFVVTGTGSDTVQFEGYQNLGRLGVDSVSLNEGNAVPEPSSLALLGLGGISLAIAARRRRSTVSV